MSNVGFHYVCKPGDLGDRGCLPQSHADADPEVDRPCRRRKVSSTWNVLSPRLKIHPCGNLQEQYSANQASSVALRLRPALMRVCFSRVTPHPIDLACWAVCWLSPTPGTIMGILGTR